MIDRHNRSRQDNLDIEKKIETKDWSKRCNLSIFAICVVDTWLAYKQIGKAYETQQDFYVHLSEELIDNTHDDVGRNRRMSRVGGDDIVPVKLITETGDIRCGIDIHLTPTKKRRKQRYGTPTKFLYQGNCRVCRKKTVHVCSKCEDDIHIQKDMWICHSKTRRQCFSTHIDSEHVEDNVELI